MPWDVKIVEMNFKHVLDKKGKFQGDCMQGILYAFLGTLFTFGITALGALNVFAVRKRPPGIPLCDGTQCNSGEKTDHTMEALTLGFAGGVMVAASIWSLFIPGMERAKELGQISYLVMSVGFLAGVGFLLAADKMIQKKTLQNKQRNIRKYPPGIPLCAEKQRDIRKHPSDIPLCAEKQRNIRKSTQMLVLAITAHNIPEGMAVGLAFALALSDPGNEALFSGALALTLGIGIQNYPEGTAVALPLMREGMSRGKAFLIGSMSAAVEPVFGVLAAALAGRILQVMPLLLAMAAGAMIYVVVQELIPEAHPDDEDKSGTLGFVVGFIIMMILDIALG